MGGQQRDIPFWFFSFPPAYTASESSSTQEPMPYRQHGWPSECRVGEHCQSRQISPAASWTEPLKQKGRSPRYPTDRPAERGDGAELKRLAAEMVPIFALASAFQIRSLYL